MIRSSTKYWSSNQRFCITITFQSTFLFKIEILNYELDRANFKVWTDLANSRSWPKIEFLLSYFWPLPLWNARAKPRSEKFTTLYYDGWQENPRKNRESLQISIFLLFKNMYLATKHVPNIHNNNELWNKNT